jgi:cytochrome c-type biogenesis protein CcmH
MEGDFYLPVRPEPKPGGTPQLDEDAMIALERTLACPCPCTLDIYTCRTTDVTCSNSPAIHRDVQRMIDGGYSGDEIVGQLTGVYGERILMAPSKTGFNLVGWFLPFVAIGTGAVLIATLLRSWRRNAIDSAEGAAGVGALGAIRVQATDDEMARLQAALRDDSR